MADGLGRWWDWRKGKSVVTAAPFAAGVWVWIWNLPKSDGGDPAAIVKRLQAAGCAGVFVKGCDGAGPFTNEWTAIAALAAALRAAGLGFATWGYNYTGAADEAAIAVKLCQTMQPAAHVFDVEQQLENLPRPYAAAMDLTAAVQAALPAQPLAYAPIGSIRNHLRAPYRQFTDAGLAMLPMCYYVGFGWTPQATLGQFYADVATYELAQQPIYPAYEDAPLAGVGSSADDVQTFATLANAAGAAGISVWVYEYLDDAGWQRVATAAQTFPAPKQPTPPPTPTNDDLEQLHRLIDAQPFDAGALVQYAQAFT